MRLSSLIVVGAAVLTPAADAGQDGKPAPAAKSVAEAAVSAPGAGSYEPIDLWSKIKLAGAYYTKPAAVRDFVIVYSFDPQAISRNGKDAALWTLGHDGKILVGIPSENSKTIQAVPFTNFIDDHKIANVEALQDALAARNGKVLTASASLLGSEADQTLLKTPPAK